MISRRQLLAAMGKTALALVAAPVALGATEPTSLGITRVVVKGWTWQGDSTKGTLKVYLHTTWQSGATHSA